MKKKHGFIFLITGIILIIIFAIYNFTGLSNGNNIISDNTLYDYINSHDVTKKTKVSFPIYENLMIDDNINDGFYKKYTNKEDLSLYALIHYTSFTEKEFADYKNTHNKSFDEQDGKSVTISPINCKYTCSRYKAYQSNNVIDYDELRVYIKIADSEVFQLRYSQKDKELSSDLINKVIDNIKVTNDATYTIGKKDASKLNIDLKYGNDKYINVSLNSMLYEEISDGENSEYGTTIKNKQSGSIAFISSFVNSPGVPIADNIGYSISASNNTLVKDGAIKLYQYNHDNRVAYAYIINEETALLVDIKNGNINIDDFANVTLK